MKSNKYKISSIRRLILKRLLTNSIRNSAIEDFEEQFLYITENKGKFAALIWYWFQIVYLVPTFIYESFIWSITMFKNYCKITIRILKRYKGFSFINITGLAVGIASTILILLWIQHEISYDRFHKNANRIFRVAVNGLITNSSVHYTYTPAPLAETLMKEYPKIKQTVRFWKINDTPIKYKQNQYYENNILAVDSTFFNIFSFPLISGDEKTALKKPNSIVITQAMANKYFGNKNPIGQVLSVTPVFGQFEFTVTGITENVPDNSHFNFDFLLSMSTFRFSRGKAWFANDFYTYIQLQKEDQADELESKFPDFISRNLFNNNYEEWAADGNFLRFYLQPLSGIHLDSNIDGELMANGDRTYVYIFSIVAMFVLLIACVNFINLTTARSVNRFKEIGIRKVVGSTRLNLIKQFLFESTFFSMTALLIGIFLVYLTLPFFNMLVNTHLSLKHFNQIYILAGLVIFALAIGLFSGAYPAFLLSSFRPISTLSGKIREGTKNYWLRNGLVVFQFSISIILIICVFMVFRQTKYMQNEKLGFAKEQVIVIKNTQSIKAQREIFKAALLQDSRIISIAASNTLPGRPFNGTFYFYESDQPATLNNYFCDFDFAEMLNIEMEKGRFFSKEFSTDSSAIVLNEKAVELLGLTDPIGKEILGSFGKGLTFHVIGVIKDFHYESMHQKVRPLALLHFLPNLRWHPPRYISARIRTDDVAGTIAFIKNKWEIFAPDVSFEYSFLEDDYNNIYNKELQTGKVFIVFSILAVFIACLGLLGLISFITEQRTKEIGIRKVLGANVQSVVLLLTKDIIKWILLANIIAWPITYLIVSKWLQNFAYRTPVDFRVFLYSAVLVLIIVLLTMSYQSVKAALNNPIKSLKYE